MHSPELNSIDNLAILREVFLRLALKAIQLIKYNDQASLVSGVSEPVIKKKVKVDGHG